VFKYTPILPLLLIGVSLCFFPSVVAAQAIRAGIIGTSKSIYNAELKAIRSAFRYRTIRPKQNYIRRSHSRSRLTKQDLNSISENGRIKTWSEVLFPDSPPSTLVDSSRVQSGVPQGFERF
jgi:hypothetical protein